MTKSMIFEPNRRNVTGKDVIEYIFPFRLIDTEKIDSQDEINMAPYHSIKVGVTGPLAAFWNLNDNDLHRVMFEYGKRHVLQKIQDGTLGEVEELDLNTQNAEIPCPYDPKKIENPFNAVIEVVPPQKKLMDDSSLLQLASSIIDARDNINAIFHQKYKEKLLLLNEERDLLQLFRDADSEEQFFFRLSALKNIATYLNIKYLRQLTGVSDTQSQSIHLLETYLSEFGDDKQNIIETLRKINKLRQGYPIHGDRSEGVLDAHRFFSLDYPITEYSASWKRLLTNYLGVLKELLELLKK